MRRPSWVALAVAFALSAAPAFGQPPLWVAHGRHATIYLFGSVHLLPMGLEWEPPRLRAAIAKADELWFELPIDNATDAAAARLSLSLGYLPAGDHLASHLTADQDSRLRRVCERLGLPADIIELLRPWLAEVTISLKADEQAGATASNGVEQQLQSLAPSSASRRALETPREQIDFLAGAGLTDQIASLDETLREVEDDPQSYQRILAGWMAGDVEELQGDALAPLIRASPVLYRRLISDRNARWTRSVARRLDGHGVAVMVVGAGHLIGPDGVPARLRAAGFKVEGP